MPVIFTRKNPISRTIFMLQGSSSRSKFQVQHQIYKIYFFTTTEPRDNEK